MAKKQENNLKARRIIGIVSLIVVIANMLLFAFRVYNSMIFWIILIVCAIIAFPIMNWLKK